MKEKVISEHNITLNGFDNFYVSYYVSSSEQEYDARIFPAHIHDAIELYISIEGNVSFVVEQNVYKLSPLDVVVVRPNEIHNCILNEKSLHKHICIWLDSDCKIFKDFIGKKTPTIISAKKVAKPEILHTINELNNASLEKDNLMEISSLLKLLRILEKNCNENVNVQNVPEKLSKILSKINCDFAEISSVDELCDEYEISRSTLCRLFKKYLNTSPITYLETKKLAYSRMLLKNGESVLDSCYGAGFTDYSNYIRLFKKKFNMTPNKYKNS